MRTVLHRLACTLLSLILLSAGAVSAGHAGDPEISSPRKSPATARTDAAAADLSARLRIPLGSRDSLLANGPLQARVNSADSDRTGRGAEAIYVPCQFAGSASPEELVPACLAPQAVTNVADVAEEISSHGPNSAQVDGITEAGSVQTEALAAMGATDWHEAGFFGRDVKVGVIDLGYAGYPDLLGTELPSQVATRNFVDGQVGTDVDTGPRHGTAVAGIIHDVAPAAEIYLAKILTPVDLAEAVDWLLEEGVEVINTSLNWYDVSPGDGTGYLADLVARARAKGVLWVSSAGDAGQRHWCGDWASPQSGEVLRFGPNERMDWLQTETGYEIRGGTMIELYLRWSDWDNVDQDYDLYLVEYGIEDPVPEVVASGTAPQAGLYGQTPTETLQFITTSAESYYAVVIKAVNVTSDIHLDLFLVGDPLLHYRVAGQSLSNLADAAGVLSVGSVNWTAPYTRFLDSSEGPTKGPGGIAQGGRALPGLTAYADVSTASEGIFSGTSAAAPHVTGAAALVLSRFPDLGAGEVEEWLYSRARDHAPLGWDPVYGHGSLYIGDEPFTPQPLLWLPLVAR
ncbi:MAG: S8 family peptidase [Anaerolineae bacterium]